MEKTDLRPKKSTLLALIREHRNDAVREDNLILKDMHWDMAFSYLNDLRYFYGPDLPSDRQTER